METTYSINRKVSQKNIPIIWENFQRAYTVLKMLLKHNEMMWDPQSSSVQHLEHSTLQMQYKTLFEGLIKQKAGQAMKQRTSGLSWPQIGSKFGGTRKIYCKIMLILSVLNTSVL